MKILNLLVTGEVGGIEILCKDFLEISKEDHRLCCLFKEGKIYDELKQSGKKVFSTVHKNLFQIEKILYKYCLENEIDAIILHHESLKGDIIFLSLMKKLKNVKFIRYNHGCFDKLHDERSFIKKFIANILGKKTLEKSNLNIYISKASKKSVIDNLKIKDNRKNIVIYNGISSRFFLSKNTENYGKIINITYIGRLEKTKGINVLIEAFSKVQKNRKDLKLMIVGKGTEQEYLKNMTKDLKIEKSVVFTGEKENVIPILDKSKIFVYPSLWEEGLGISVIEAMARGCIAIVSNKGGLPELIDNEVNGIVSTQKNLADKLEFVLNMKAEEQKEMSKRAKEKAKRFRIENTISELESAISDLF